MSALKFTGGSYGAFILIILPVTNRRLLRSLRSNFAGEGVTSSGFRSDYVWCCSKEVAAELKFKLQHAHHPLTRSVRSALLVAQGDARSRLRRSLLIIDREKARSNPKKSIF